MMDYSYKSCFHPEKVKFNHAYYFGEIRLVHRPSYEWEIYKKTPTGSKELPKKLMEGFEDNYENACVALVSVLQYDYKLWNEALRNQEEA